MSRLRVVLHKVSWFFIIVGMFCLMVIVFLTSANVFSRYLLNDEIIGSITFAEMCLVVVTFIGLSWTQIKRGHVAAEFFVNHFPKRGQQFSEVFINVVSLFFTIILVWASWEIAMTGYHNNETIIATGMQIPMWHLRFVLPLGVGLYVFTLLFNLKDSLVALVKGSKE